MTDILVTSPYRPFTLPNQFKAVFNGYVYCGTVDAVDPSVSQVQVYKINEDGSRTQVAQPLRTNAGGYLVYNGQPAKFVTDSNHSLLVRDSLGAQIWYEPDMANIDPQSFASILSGIYGSGMIGSASYADVRLYTGQGSLLNVYGRSNVFDGASGVFALDKTDTTSEDNGGTILVDAIGRRWKRQYTHSVNLLWFADQSSPDCYDGIMAAYEFAKSTNYRALYIPSGIWAYSSTLDFDSPMFKIHGDGRFNSVFHYTGGGVAMQFTDANPNHGTYAYGGQIEDFGVRGNASAIGLIRVKYVHHFNAKNINLYDASPTVGYGLRLEGIVSGYWENIVCSVNAQLMSSRPFNGIVVDRESVTQAMSTNNTFVNVIIEGMTGDGLSLLGSEQSTFIGGTSEANFGNGLTVLFGCRENTFIGVAFEQNHSGTSYADVSDAGFSSKYINCYTGKDFIFEANSLFGLVDGGLHQSVHDNGSYNEIKNIQYSFFANNGVFAFNNTSTCRNIYNKQLNAIEFKKRVPQSISLTGSPFTYTNGTGMDEEIVIQGGTVSSVLFDRGGNQVFLPISTLATLKPQDKVTVTYTSPPLVSRIPL